MTAFRGEIWIIVTDQEPTNVVILYDDKRKLVEEYEFSTQNIHDLLDQIDSKNINLNAMELELERLCDEKSEEDETKATRSYFKAMLESGFGQAGFPEIHNGELATRNI